MGRHRSTHDDEVADRSQERSLDERINALARDIASCALVNAGSFMARIPGDRREPRFSAGEFVVDLFDGHLLVAQVVVRDLRSDRPTRTSGTGFMGHGSTIL